MRGNSDYFIQLIQCIGYIVIFKSVMTVKQIQGYDIYMNKLLGKGSYGSVYIGRKTQNNEQVAVKILPKQIDKDDYLKAALKNEIDILQKLHSENVVAFYDVMESSKNYYIIQELCDGDLSKDIKRNHFHSEADAVEMLRQICNGFLALVKEGIIHRDLKPANIMKKGNLLKLGDFGFAKQIKSQSEMNATTVGTPLYMSLQILKSEPYTSKCDIWALGFIFYEILHGKTPWIANTEVQLVKNIETMALKIERNDLSPETVDFLQRCLQLKEKDRISWDEIYAHQIFRGYFTSKTDNREFENKLKMILNKLRFYISKNNLNLQMIMNSMGFSNQVHEISFNDFFNFLKNAYPEITIEEADYCFKKVDTDNSSSISVSELRHMFISNGIKLDRQFESMPIFERKNTETFNRISPEISAKIQSCFTKLYKLITRNKLTLQKVFNDFDKKKGRLTLDQFALLMKKLSGSTIQISDDQIRLGFQLIDQDNSNTIEFSELNKYYCKINGVIANNPPRNEPMQIQGPETLQFRNSSYKRQNIYEQPNQPYEQPNPFYQMNNAIYNQFGQGQQSGWNQNPQAMNQGNQPSWGNGQQGWGQGSNTGNIGPGFGYPPQGMNNSYPQQNYQPNYGNNFNQPNNNFSGNQQAPLPPNFNPFALLQQQMNRQ